MIYLFEQGEYSDYCVVAHYEGPDNFDFTEFFNVIKETKKFNTLLDEKWDEQYIQFELDNPELFQYTKITDNDLKAQGLTKRQRQDFYIQNYHNLQEAFKQKYPQPNKIGPTQAGFRYLEANGFKEVNVTHVDLETQYD